MRLTTDGNGNILSQQGTFPFGESWYSNLGPGENWVFTSYDRDAESGLDYALARYYDSRTGTMCSADPVAGSPTNPRRIFDETALNELAESIRTQGMLSPLLVRPINPQTYEVVAGRRRFRAAQRAGVESVPADIRELTDAQCLEIAIVENLQRRDVQPLEEAEGFVSFSRLPVCPSSVATHDVSERLD